MNLTLREGLLTTTIPGAPHAPSFRPSDIHPRIARSRMGSRTNEVGRTLRGVAGFCFIFVFGLCRLASSMDILDENLADALA